MQSEVHYGHQDTTNNLTASNALWSSKIPRRFTRRIHLNIYRKKNWPISGAYHVNEVTIYSKTAFHNNETLK